MPKILPVKATGEKDNSFIGIKAVNDTIEFHYPEAYTLSSDKDLRKDIFNILRTFRLTNSRTDEKSELNRKFQKRNIYPLSSFLYILNDYLENKRYTNKEKVIKIGHQGKIDWNRTMRQMPFYSKGNLIFPVFICESTKQQDNILTEIYLYCVYTSIKEIGWYFGIANSEFSKKDFSFNKNRYLYALNDAINITYDDKKRLRLNHMKNIITGLDEKSIRTKSFVRGVDSYEHIFEAMVDIAFGNVEYKKKFFPNAEWHLNESDKTTETSKLRPDSIVVKDRKVFILDSKFYRYGTTFKAGDLPDTTSIEKQITYAEYAKKIGTEYDQVYNAFVVPYSKDDNIHKDKYNKPIEYVGYAVAKWPMDNTNTDKKVAVILIDLKYLIDNYLKIKDTEVQNLIDLIENKIA